MKIRTLISAGAATSVALVVFIVVALVDSVVDVRESTSLAKAADELTKSVADLQIVVVETIIDGAERPAAKWHRQHDSLRQFLDRAARSAPGKPTVLDRIRANDASLDVLYSRLVDADKSGGPASIRIGGQDSRASTMSALLATSQTMLDDAFRVVKESQAEAEAAQKRALLLFLTLIAMIGVMVAGIWRLFRRRILAPIAELQRGTERIAAGALDHRIGMAARDEIGALAGSFDRMAEQLQATRTDLEAEIAERKLAAESLRQTEERLRLMVDSVVDYAIFTLDPAGRITSWNAGAQRIKGYRAAEIVGQHYSRFYGSDDIERGVPQQHLLQAETEGRSEDEGWRVRKDGSTFWANVIITAVRDDAGNLLGFTKVTRDLTARRQAEDALREGREQFRAVTETASDAIISADALGRITYFNAAAQRIFGYSAADVLGQSLTLLMPERFREAHRQGFQRFLDTGEARIIGQTLELTATNRDRREFPMEISVSTWTTGEGTFFTAILRDITARKVAAEALRQLNEQLEHRVHERTTELEAALRELGSSERHYRMLFEANPHPMWVYDFETLAFLAVNDAAIRQYGYTREEFLRMSILDINPPGDREAVSAAIRSIDASKANFGTARHRRKDGEVIEVESMADGIEFLGRTARLVLASDITERSRTEAEIQRVNANLERIVEERTSAMEAANKELEAFSYSVSHDLRAPLRHIGGFADMLRHECEAVLDESGRRYLDVISDSVTHMGRLIDDLLTFSRMGRVELHTTTIRMDRLVSDVLQELAADADGRNIEWDIHPLPEVPGDRSMLRQVWINLLSNAIKYTRRRDRAKITVACHPGDGEFEFFVQDNGVGFDTRYADKLFGVFQRLHRAEDFEGTGVGLANVQRIVRRHGGRTRAVGETDRGATFFFTLPASAAEQP